MHRRVTVVAVVTASGLSDEAVFIFVVLCPDGR